MSCDVLFHIDPTSCSLFIKSNAQFSLWMTHIGEIHVAPNHFPHLIFWSLLKSILVLFVSFSLGFIYPKIVFNGSTKTHALDSIRNLRHARRILFSFLRNINDF